MQLTTPTHSKTDYCKKSTDTNFTFQWRTRTAIYRYSNRSINLFKILVKIQIKCTVQWFPQTIMFAIHPNCNLSTSTFIFHYATCMAWSFHQSSGLPVPFCPGKPIHPPLCSWQQTHLWIHLSSVLPPVLSLLQPVQITWKLNSIYIQLLLNTSYSGSWHLYTSS